MAEFSQYREITAKLKKRFTLRKPNFREASASFKKLSNELSDFKDYAGYCMLSAAQCEHNIVGALHEQQLSRSSSFGNGSKSGTTEGTSIPGSSRASSTSPRPGSAVSTASTSPFSHLTTTDGLGLDRILQASTLTEFQTWLDTARLFNEADEVNGAISAFAHAAQICPEHLLPLIYAEWASIFLSRERYFEAASIYLEGGLLREAIDALLTGQYFEDAYNCFLELFKLAKKDFMLPMTNIELCRTSSVQGSSNLLTKSPKIFAKTSLPFFGKQKSTESISNKSPLTSLHQLPAKCNGGPFADSSYLTIDDYITTFLLRLYLYDPVKYEYPSPIIPLPNDLVQNNPNLRSIYRTQTNEIDENEIIEDKEPNNAELIVESPVSSSSTFGTDRQSTVRASQTQIQPEIQISESFLPFVDFLNCRRSERTISDLIELNMLLETLYLSYRYELRNTIDQDYANDGDDSISLNSDSDDSDSNVDDCDDLEFQDAHSSITASPIKHKIEILPEMLVTVSRRDSIDDDPPTTTTTTTTNATSNSGSTSTFEKNDLDDISHKLKQLAIQFGSSSENRRRKTSSTKNRNNKKQSCEPGGEGNFSDIEQKLVYQQRMLLSDGDNDEHLRRQLASKLYPLLNGNQNQLVYLILNNKD
ncbi:hypothetical protein BLOT_003176 [Blomia tropicalis]|nr:hypothetical protein BLOT_003176 [Blomia tropicalis]